MKQWPALKTEEKAPRKLRAWKFSSDGSFWGGVLAVLIWFSVCGTIVVLVLEQSPTP